MMDPGKQFLNEKKRIEILIIEIKKVYTPDL